MAREVTIALAQLLGEPYEPDRNRAKIETTARRAFDQGANLIVLPEMIVPGYVADESKLRAVAEPLDGPTVASWQALAAERDGAFIAGGFCELADDGLFNTAVVVGPEGVVLHYRKLHLFAEEKNCFVPGDLGLPVAELPFGTVGMCVCYDLRFVETARALALQGADLILVPTAWLTGFDQVKWLENGLAPQAQGAVLQANLDQVFIACSSQPGAGGTDFLGSSVLVGPTGDLVLGPAPGVEEDLVVATVDLDDAVAAQRRSDLIRPREDRRTDVYGISVGKSVL